MKKITVTVLVIAAIVVAACNNNETKSSETTESAEVSTASTDAAASAALSNNPVYQKGLELQAKSDCATCHRVTEKVVGPSFSEIANKYADMPDTIVTHLASKVIKGGGGVWGPVMMAPHPNISQADAEALVKYILLLKK